MKALFIFSIMLFAGCDAGARTERGKLVSADGHESPELNIEIADTPGARQLGLMYRKELKPTDGMLFIFPDDEKRSFWMKNTYVELDMVFIDDHGKVVNVVERATPLTETPRESAGPARYVLEILGGQASKWGIGANSYLVMDSGKILRGPSH